MHSLSMSTMQERIEAVLAGLDGVTPGPWAYRPWQYDDWGVVRAPQGNGHDLAPFIAHADAGRGVTEDEKAEHRRNRTDPYGANAAHIARLDPDFVLQLCTLALSALSTQRGGEAAAVAWRWRYFRHGEPSYWRLCSTPMEPSAETDGAAGIEVQPLYATPQDQSDGMVLDVDELAGEIRYVDPENKLGAGALAEALMPLLRIAFAVSPQPSQGEGK
jgi:hypothetical protein